MGHRAEKSPPLPRLFQRSLFCREIILFAQIPRDLAVQTARERDQPLVVLREQFPVGAQGAERPRRAPGISG